MLRFSFLFLRCAKGIPKGHHSLAAFKPGMATGTGGIAEHIKREILPLLTDDNGNDDLDELDDEVAAISKRSPTNMPKQTSNQSEFVNTDDI